MMSHTLTVDIFDRIKFISSIEAPFVAKYFINFIFSSTGSPLIGWARHADPPPEAQTINESDLVKPEIVLIIWLVAATDDSSGKLFLTLNHYNAQ